MADHSKEHEDVHSEGKKRWDDWWAANFRESEEAMNDRRFVSEHGGQYQGPLEEEFENRPKPEINKCKMAQRRINSEYRKNPITADFIAKDGAIDDELASQLDGAYRSDEQEYGGQEAYDGCADEGFSGGRGAYGLRAVWEDEFDPENEHQRIEFYHIPDADISVAFDMNSKRQDKSDATWGGIVTAMTREAWEDEYDGDPSSWPQGANTEFWEWFTPDLVYIFEYYRVEIGTRKVLVFKVPGDDNEEVRIFEDEIEEDPDKELMLMLLATGHEHLKDRDREIKVKEVFKYIMDGQRILEGPDRVPGNVIPIAIQYGERYIINGLERYNGFVRVLKDPQMLYNMLVGILGELAVNGTKEVPIFAPSQMPQKLADHWANANRDQLAYLLAEPLKDGDGKIIPKPLEFTRAPQVPPALAALINVVGVDIKELLGEGMNQDEIVSNISGKAVELIQQTQDLPHFIFLDNARKARKRGVEIWLAMAKELYVEDGRELRTVGADGNMGQIVIGRKKLDENKAVQTEFDIRNSNIGVYADVGPASVSKKAAAAREFIAAYSTAPPGSEEAFVLLASAFLNMEGEGIEELRPYWRKKLIGFGAIEPNKEEKAEIADQQAAQAAAPPDANQTFLLSEAKKNEATAVKTGADTFKTLAQTEEIKANTVETLADIDREDLRQAAEAKQALNDAVPAQPLQTGER